MATYGASIPAKVFRQFGYVNYTRHGLAHVLARALDYVGMKLCDAIAPYNILDPANAESNDASHSTNGRAAIFVFDFPTSENFSLRFAGEAADRTYRPCFVMALTGATDVANGPVSAGHHVAFHVGFRPDRVNFGLTDIVSFNSLRASPTQYNGLAESASTSGAGADLNRYLSFPGRTGWKPYATSSFVTAINTLQVRHLCVYLGPGGLMLCGGTNDQTQDKSGLFDLWNTWVFFGGERIPNRARIPANDPELTRVCPVFQVCGNTSAQVTWKWSTTYAPDTGGARVYGLAAQYADRNSYSDAQAVAFDLYALDLLDLRFGQLGTFPTVVSPQIVATVPRNLLSPLVLRPTNGFETVGPGAIGKYFPLTSDGVYGLDSWETLYYSASFRASDASLAMGEITDPDTSTKWWGHWWNDFTSAVAFKLGASYSTTATLPTKSYGTATVSTWDFSGVTVTSGVDVPAGAGIPSITNMTASFASGSVGAFAQVASQDYFESVISTATAAVPQMDFVIDWPAGVDTDYQVEVSFSAFLRGGTEANANFTLAFQYESVTHQSSTWVTMFTMQSAGANTGHASYNYTNRGAFRISTGALTRDGKLRFRVVNTRSLTSGTNPYTARWGGLSVSFKKWQ